MRRKDVRKFLELLYVEIFIISVVLLYSIVIFFQLAVETDELDEDVQQTLQIIDVVFLSIFVVEIMVKFYAFGLAFLKDPYNLVDGIVVVVSFILTIIAATTTGGAASDMNLLRILRLARIFRVILIMNKIQRSRESANLLRKRAMYRKIGAPVEKVLETLVEMKDRAEASDQDNLSWIIEVIASDQLYTVNLNNDNDTDVDNEMSAWLNQNANLTKKGGGPQKEKAVPDGEQQAGDGTLPNAVNGPTRHNSDQPHLWVDQSLEESAVSAALGKITKWEFDVFELDRVSNHHPLIIAAYHLAISQGLLSEFDIPHQKFLNFWTKIEAGYKNNPYHNAIHAADVLISTNYYMQQPNFKMYLQPIDVLAGLISGGIHDFEHPGFNNAFLQNTKGDLAVLYNDMSILENHHVAAAWRLLLKDEYSFLENMVGEQYTDLRETIISSVLGTDMKHHFEHLTKFKTKLASEGFRNDAQEGKKDMRLLMMMAVHSADTSNPLKPFKTSVEWSMRVMEAGWLVFSLALSDMAAQNVTMRFSRLLLSRLLTQLAWLSLAAFPIKYQLRRFKVRMFLGIAWRRKSNNICKSKVAGATCKEEFFMQGDREKELGLPTSPFMDREKTSVAQCQIGFINVLVKPLHQEFCQFLGEQAIDDCLTCVNENVGKWEQEGNNLLDRDFSKAPQQYIAAREAEAKAVAAADSERKSIGK